jgi:acetyltransferase
MILETKVSRILSGVRGERPLDIPALVESLLRLSQLMIDFPEIEGIDINPVKVLEKGVVCVDARIQVTKSEIRISNSETNPNFKYSNP